MKKWIIGNSLADQWLRLGAFIARIWVQSLVGELRSHKPHSTAKKGKKNSQQKTSSKNDELSNLDKSSH